MALPGLGAATASDELTRRTSKRPGNAIKRRPTVQAVADGGPAAEAPRLWFVSFVNLVAGLNRQFAAETLSPVQKSPLLELVRHGDVIRSECDQCAVVRVGGGE